MLRVAKEQNTNLAAVKMSTHLCQELPAWYHIDDQLASLSSRSAKCLLEKHAVSTVADLVSVLARIRSLHPPEMHRPTPFCPCQDCMSDQGKGCYNPHECALEALVRLRKVSPKLNPLGLETPRDLLSLTPTRKAANLQANMNNEAITFNLSLTCYGNLAECFRVFTDPA